MQIVFNDQYNLEVGTLAPQPQNPEGSVTVLITEPKSGLSVLIAIPRLQAAQFGRRIAEIASTGLAPADENGKPPFPEPVYGREVTVDEDVMRTVTDDGPRHEG